MRRFQKNSAHRRQGKTAIKTKVKTKLKHYWVKLRVKK